jgi:hypothetical protein
MKKTILAATIKAVLSEKNSVFYQSYFESLPPVDEGKRKREAFFKLRADEHRLIQYLTDWQKSLLIKARLTGRTLLFQRLGKAALIVKGKTL